MLLDSILPHPVSSGNECDKRSLNIAIFLISFINLSYLFPILTKHRMLKNSCHMLDTSCLKGGTPCHKSGPNGPHDTSCLNKKTHHVPKVAHHVIKVGPTVHTGTSCPNKKHANKITGHIMSEKMAHHAMAHHARHGHIMPQQ